MDFQFSESEERLRGEVKAFLAETLGEGYDAGGSELSDDDFAFSQAFNKQLAARGWIAPAWPTQYGGLGASYIEQMIFSEELAGAGAPGGGRIFGVGMIGPTLIVHGSDEQKARHLPGITGGDVLWCQGYSEPGAGSDLAALQTRAVRDGDDYVVNGQKIWTTQAHLADWMFLLARTDPEAPKHKGISFFLMDMKSPGVSVNALVNMAGRHEFNEVFFDNVRIPAKNLVGEENRGFYVAMTLLDFERSSVGSIASNGRTLREMLAFARETAHNGVSVGTLPWVRNAFAELWLETEVSRMLSYRVAAMQQKGQMPNYEASIVKVFATEASQRMYNFGTKMLGLYGQLSADSKWARLQGKMENGYLSSVAPTIYSGSNEIQRNVIATRGLGLPRD